MKRFSISIISFFSLSLLTHTAFAAYKITSPDGQLVVEVQTGNDGLGWTVSRAGHIVYTENGVSVNVGGKNLGRSRNNL